MYVVTRDHSFEHVLRTHVKSVSLVKTEAAELRVSTHITLEIFVTDLLIVIIYFLYTLLRVYFS